MSSNIKDFIKCCINNYIVRNESEYYFLINNQYKIPKYIISNSHHKINIQNNRDKLLKNQSPYSLNMKNYLNNNKISYIQEFIIIIENRSLWEYILNMMNINEYKDINYFSLDYFLENSLTCIEVDSDYHNNKKKFDQARDIYLKLYYNIETFRFYHFIENNYHQQLLILKNRINNLNFEINTSLFDYRGIILNDFLYSNEYLLQIIENFLNLVGNKLLTNNSFMLTEMEYNFLANNLNLDSGLYPIDLLNDFVELVENVFYIKIEVCKNVINFTTKDIISIAFNNYIDYKTVLRKFKRIPYWVYMTINKPIPNELKHFLNPCTGEDIFIKKYIDSGFINKQKTYV